MNRAGKDLKDNYNDKKNPHNLPKPLLMCPIFLKWYLIYSSKEYAFERTRKMLKKLIVKRTGQVVRCRFYRSSVKRKEEKSSFTGSWL